MGVGDTELNLGRFGRTNVCNGSFKKTRAEMIGAVGCEIKNIVVWCIYRYSYVDYTTYTGENGIKNYQASGVLARQKERRSAFIW